MVAPQCVTNSMCTLLRQRPLFTRTAGRACAVRWETHFAGMSGRLLHTSPVSASAPSRPSYRTFSSAISSERLANLEKEVEVLRGEVSLLKNAHAEMEVKLNKKGGIAKLFTEYGAPFVAWYFSLWAGGLATLYGVMQFGLVGWQDAKEFLIGLGVDKYYDLDNVDPKTGNFAVAFLLNELVEPLRLPLAIATIKPLMKLLKR
eukprot:GEMP01027409.1.p1 GENE.GEMP01027409.1~~GEMP01027409.1.p1  ORF type:complete len:203 (+),score=44.68 GEMP01027409.1:234-842(+)